MIKIGLSGTRYSGKDRIAKIFKQIQIPVFEADVVLKFILQHNYQLQSVISDAIGQKYFNNGCLILEKVKTDGMFGQVLDIVQFEIFKTWEKFLEKNRGSVYCIFHSSVLFETGWCEKMDKNISVYAPLLERVERCKLLTKKTTSSIHKQLSQETDDLEKNELSDFVIHNYEVDGYYGDTFRQVNFIDQQIIDEFIKDDKQTKNMITF